MRKVLCSPARLLMLVLAASLLLVPTAQARTDDGPLTASQREWLEDHGPIVFAGPLPSAPVVLADDEGRPTGGWGVALIELLGLKLGIDVRVDPYASIEEAVAAVREGRADATTPLGERPDLLAFADSGTPWSWTPVVFTTAKQDLTSIDDLTGRTATTIPGSPMEAILADLHPEATYVVADSLPDAVARMASGEVDVMLGPLAIIGHQLQDLAPTVRVVGDPARVVEVAPWAPVGSPALGIIEAGRLLMTESELAVTHQRWTGFDLTLPDETTNQTTARLALVLAGIALVLTAFSLYLRRRVRVATAELRDLTDHLEDRVAQQTNDLATTNLRLRSSNRALANFAHSVAHDLRGPITAVGGLAAMARRRGIPEDQRSHILDRIEGAAERQNETIVRLLDAAEARSQEQQPVLTTTDLGDWLGELMGPELDSTGASLSFEGTEAPLDVDLDVLSRVLLNLVGNAVKHGGEGVAVTVTLDRDEEAWGCRVEDDGPGIPQAHWTAVFGRGVQLDPETPGRGLGLFGVREDVEAVGGSIELGHGSAGGAAFTVTLPVRTLAP